MPKRLTAPPGLDVGCKIQSPFGAAVVNYTIIVVKLSNYIDDKLQYLTAGIETAPFCLPDECLDHYAIETIEIPCRSRKGWPVKSARKTKQRY
jgi:hypothetical protein